MERTEATHRVVRRSVKPTPDGWTASIGCASAVLPPSGYEALGLPPLPSLTEPANRAADVWPSDEDAYVEALRDHLSDPTALLPLRYDPDERRTYEVERWSDANAYVYGRGTATEQDLRVAVMAAD